MRLSLLTFALTLLFAWQANAQKLPKTNVYLFEMEQTEDNFYRFDKPLYLTAFNPKGYNNQPVFINDDEIYLTVQMANDTSQTDIYSLNLRTRTKTQVTATLDSEYSPQAKPGTSTDEGPMFSCVRAEADGNNTQRLWEFPMDRSNKGEPSYDGIEDVGYYLWLTYKKAAMFLVGNPHRLIIADKMRNKVINVTAKIGRCFQKLPNGNMAYVHKLSDNTWLLKELNPDSKKSELITATMKGKEDFVVLPDGTFIMGNGSKLYKFNKQKDNSWIEIGDFKHYGIRNISRLAVRGNRIAIVTM